MARQQAKAQINLPVPREELEAFKAAAEAVGLSLSMWMRQAARAAAGLPGWRAPAEPLSAPPPAGVEPAEGPRSRPGRASRRY